MHITKVIGSHIKGQDFQADLTPVTIITGLNARGKSTRIEAGILALAGYLPGLSTKSGEIFGTLASAGTTLMQVGVVMDNGWEIHRAWELKRGSVKTSATWKGFETDYAIAPIAVDPSEYFGLSDIERVKFIFRLAKMTGLTTESIAKTIISNVKNIKLEPHTPLAEEEINKLVTEILTLDQKISVQEYVDELASGIKDKLKLANENARRMASTVQGLTQMQTEAAPSDVEARIAKARRELETANTETANALSELNSLNRQLETANQKRIECSGEAELRRQIGQVEEQIEQLKKLPTGSVDTSDLVTTSKKAEQDHKANEFQCDKLGAEVKRLELEIEACDKNTTCPTCGHDLKAQKAKLKEKFQTDLESVKKQVEEAEGKFNTTAEALDKADTALQAAMKQQRENSANMTSLNQENTKLSEMRQRLNGFAAASVEVAKIPALEKSITEAKARYKKAAEISVEKKTANDNLDAEHRRLIAARADASKRAQAIEDAAKKQVEADVLSQVKDLIEELQVKVVEQALTPILTKCNMLCEGLLRWPLAFKDGDIGMQSNTGFIRHHGFSDSEKLLAYASLCISLASDAPIKLCIIGRFESFDVENKRKVLSRVCKLIDDKGLDQALIVEVQASEGEYMLPIQNENLSVIQL